MTFDSSVPRSSTAPVATSRRVAANNGSLQAVSPPRVSSLGTVTETDDDETHLSVVSDIERREKTPGSTHLLKRQHLNSREGNLSLCSSESSTSKAYQGSSTVLSSGTREATIPSVSIIEKAAFVVRSVQSSNGRSGCDAENCDTFSEIYDYVYADCGNWPPSARARVTVARNRQRERTEEMHGRSRHAVEKTRHAVMRVLDCETTIVSGSHEQAMDEFVGSCLLKGGGDQRGLPTCYQQALWKEKPVPRENGTINSPRSTAGFVAEVVGKRKVLPMSSPTKIVAKSVLSPRGSHEPRAEATASVHADQDVWVRVGLDGIDSQTSILQQDPSLHWMIGHRSLPPTKSIPTSMRRRRLIRSHLN